MVLKRRFDTCYALGLEKVPMFVNIDAKEQNEIAARLKRYVVPTDTWCSATDSLGLDSLSQSPICEALAEVIASPIEPT